MRIDVRRYWKYPLVLALAGVLFPASLWVANGLVPSSSTTVAAAGATEPPELRLPDSALESRLLAQTAGRLEEERRLAAEQAVAEAEAKRLAEEQAAQAAREARQAAARERASRNAARPRPAEAAAAPGAEDDIWAKLRKCEAGGVYTRNSGNGYYGAYQFAAATWRSLGYSGLPHEAPPEVQDEAARKLQARSGWGQWPACSRRIGAR